MRLRGAQLSINELHFLRREKIYGYGCKFNILFVKAIIQLSQNFSNEIKIQQWNKNVLRWVRFWQKKKLVYPLHNTHAVLTQRQHDFNTYAKISISWSLKGCNVALGLRCTFTLDRKWCLGDKTLRCSEQYVDQGDIERGNLIHVYIALFPWRSSDSENSWFVVFVNLTLVYV